MEFWEIDSNTVALKFFGEIGTWYRNASDFTNTFNQLERKYSNIIIKAHCYGGSVFEGNVIFNAIAMSKANVTYEIVGVSASMSSIVQLACRKVRICDNAFVMVHRPTGGASGNADDMFATAKLLKSLEGNFAKTYKAKTGKKDADIAKLMDGADHWMTAQEALDFGLVDEIIGAEVKDVAGIVKPLTIQEADTIYQQFAASLTNELPFALTIPSNNSNKNLMKELIILMFGLTNLTKDSSDTAVAEALKGLVASKDSALTNLQAKYEELQKGQAGVAIAAAEVRMGKPFEATQKANLESIGKESLAALNMALTFLQPAPAQAAAPAADSAAPATPAAAPTALSLIAGGKAAGTVDPARASWTWSEWCEKDEKGLKALSDEAQAEIYKRSYNVEMPK